MIDESQVSPAHNVLSTTKLKSQQLEQPPHNNRPKRLLLKASSYLSTGHSNVTSPQIAKIEPHKQISSNMKIAKKKVRLQTPLVNPIIDMERPLDKVLKKREYITIKCHHTPGDNDSGSYEINFSYYEGGSGVTCLERQITQDLRCSKHQTRTIKVHVH